MTLKRKRVKDRKPPVVLAGRDPTTQLYRAVKRYVESKGGSIVVIGGVSLQQWPEDNTGVFHLAVKFMGRKPELPEEKQ